MAFWTYMLRCTDGRYYVGHTDALEQRIAQHEAGKGCSYTAKRLPVAFVRSQDFATREEALTAERQIKGWSRAKKEALIEGDWSRLHELAVSREPRPSTTLRTNGVNGASVVNGDPFVLSEVEARAADAPLST